ncbi:ComF family protein [Aquibacillus sediminis]|uniref:ComF family protein n=1 Tax=Aquibacillus sediminis TaxID=2574734 RepID=UPI001108B7D9|nr:ComF family protein [Aquibacillus sediminis]
MHCLSCDQEIIVEVNWNTLFKPAPEPKLCPSCEAKLERIAGKQCKRCSRLTDQTVCPDCQKWEHHPTLAGALAFNQSVYTYNDFLKEIIAKWKYRGDYVLREAFADAFRDQFNITFKQIKKDAVLVPIPLSDRRLQERSFNQAEALAQVLDTPYQQALTRIHSEKQSKKTRHDRLASANPFQVKTPLNKPVILVDDIYTTGVTLRHAANVLRESGCPKVYAYTLARG